MQLDRSKLTCLGKTYVTAGKAQEITLAEIEYTYMVSNRFVFRNRIPK